MSRAFPDPASILLSAALLCLLPAAKTEAQPGEGPRHASWELNLHAAVLRPGLFDESAGALQFGGRLVRNFGSGVSFGGSVDWARPEDVTLATLAGQSASLLLYSAELDYRFRVSPRTEFFLGAGVGAATLTLDQPPLGVAESSTGLLVPVGGGFKILNRPVSPTWALRFDVRDNVILLEALNADGDIETEPRNNVEASVGVSLLFGGASSGEPIAADRDTDRDGVPDPRDFCLNRPGARVDARGCPMQPEPTPGLEAEPVAEPDADLDGVPDAIDGCLGTPPGVAVQADGCPAPPPAEAPAEALPGDSDGDGVADERDACPGTRAGLAIDERGCLARPEPREEAPELDAAPPPLPAAVSPEVVPEPAPADEPAPGAATACLDAAAGERTIEFEGRRFRPTGFPQTVDRTFLVQVGSFDDLPIYVSDTARKPYADFWVPHCSAEDTFELFVEVGALP